MLGRKRSLDQTQAAAMRQVETTLNNTVAEIFTERKLSLILRRDQTAFFNPSMDITEEVIKRLDQRLPPSRSPPQASRRTRRHGDTGPARRSPESPRRRGVNDQRI
jgi:hypothetical protein